jgi:hypothetical protein
MTEVLARLLVDVEPMAGEQQGMSEVRHAVTIAEDQVPGPIHMPHHERAEQARGNDRDDLSPNESHAPL